MPAKRRSGKSSGRSSKAVSKSKLTRDLIGLALIALGIFMLVSVFFADLTGAFGLAARDVIFGVFGVVAYVVPFLMIVIGWLIMISWKANVHNGKVFAVSALVVLCVALVHLIYDGGIRQGLADKPGFGEYVEVAFLYGINRGAGAGALGGMLTWPLTEFLGGVGSIILVIAALLGCAALLTRFSLGDAGRKMTKVAYDAASNAIQYARASRGRRPEPAEDWEEPAPLKAEDPDDWKEDSFLGGGEPVSVSWRSPSDKTDTRPIGRSSAYTGPAGQSEPGREDFPGNRLASRPRPRRLPNEHIQRPKGRRKPEPEVIDLLTGKSVGSWSAEPRTMPLPQAEDAVAADMAYDLVTQDGETGFGDPMGVPVEMEEPLTRATTIEREGLAGAAGLNEMGLPTHEIPAEDDAPLDLPMVEKGEGQANAAIQAVNALPKELPPPPPYQKPQLDLLSAPPNTEAADRRARREQEERARLLVETLRSFGIESTVVGVYRGPVLTRYEIKPAAGVKVSRITGLADDIALNMAAAGVRIEAPIPGKAAIGIEVPNLEVVPVTLREVLMSEEFQKHPSHLAMALGMDITGKPVVGDLADMPHVLIAGATGSGKSVCINSMVTSILYKASPEEVKLIMIDPKVVELVGYNGIPHLLIPVVTDPKKAAGALNWAVQEMESRYKKFAASNCRDLKGYNLYAKQNGFEPLYQLVVIVDELADLMIVASREVEEYINRLAQLARAAGIHLVIATQRPSVNVITGVIKANIPSRIAFAVASQVDSRTILDIAGAEKLLGKGDMLYDPRGASKPRRVQGCLITDGELQRVVEVVKRTNREADYNPDILESLERIGAPEVADPGMEPEGGGGVDDLLQQAIELALDTGQISVSMLQRRYKIGYARAGRLIDEMEQRGIVSGYGGSKAREVLMTRDEYNRLYIQG